MMPWLASGHSSVVNSWFHWFSTPPGIAVVSIVTLVGLPLAVYGIARTARASTAARRASEYSRTVLRTADLRRTVEVTRELGRQIATITPGEQNSADRFVALANAWIDAEEHVFGLVKGLNNSMPGLLNFQAHMLAAAAEMNTAREQADSGRRWNRYRIALLRERLHDYSQAAEALLLFADDEVLNA
jgi:hypothetical protein